MVLRDINDWNAVDPVAEACRVIIVKERMRRMLPSLKNDTGTGSHGKLRLQVGCSNIRKLSILLGILWGGLFNILLCLYLLFSF